MNIGLFGGTFDPIHRGHLAVARAAQQAYELKQVLFVPSGNPPHKTGQPLTPFHHRYAMVALATAMEPGFIPSLLEDVQASDDASLAAQNQPMYSINTVRRLKATLGRKDRLFFIIGVDAFGEIGEWREPEALLREAEFVVVSRPGFSLADIGRALPPAYRPRASVTEVFRKQPASGDIVLGDITLHVLTEVSERVSATQIRAAARSGRSLGKLVPEAVADYIRKTRLYRTVEKTTTARASRSPRAHNVRDRKDA